MNSKFKMFVMTSTLLLFPLTSIMAQDVFISALTLSILLINKPSIRLFFETMAENNPGNEILAGIPP